MFKNFKKNWIIAHLRKRQILYKEISSWVHFKDLYNHNILSITSSYIFLKIHKHNIYQSIFNSFSYTSKSYWTLPKKHVFVSNTAWFTKFFPPLQNSKDGYVDIQTLLGEKIWYLSLIISVINESTWLAQMLNYETTLCKMHLLHLKRS